jgi:hypothetical protein
MSDNSDNSPPGTSIEHVYEDRLLAFIDILGFRSLIAKTEADTSHAATILQHFSSLDRLLRGMSTAHFDAIIFSDTICISSREVQNFSTFCLGLSLVIVGMLGMGYPVRGAIVQGKLYHRGNIIFGPGLVRAYELEHRMALYPRTIIDPQLTIEPDSLSAQFAPTYNDHDGMRCVNFLSPTLLEVTARFLGASSADQLLAVLLPRIAGWLNEPMDDSVKQKLTYLANYALKTYHGACLSEAEINKIVTAIRSTMK